MESSREMPPGICIRAFDGGIVEIWIRKEPLDQLELWVRGSALALGLMALILPMIQAWRAGRAQYGRALGRCQFLAHWPVALAINLASILAGILLWRPVALAITSPIRLTLLLAGSLLYFPGLVLYGWGLRTLGSMFGISSISTAHLYEGHRLVVDGPYAHIRHPMYLGVILVAMGALMLFRTWTMVVFAPLSLVVILRAQREETLMAAEFGEEWARYRGHVPQWIPRLRAKGLRPTPAEVDSPREDDARG
jgi:protein-S-isoprenylcysteine O-methyltransferase Ste14